VAVPIILGVAYTSPGRAQSADNTLKFDVASIKPCKDEPTFNEQRRADYLLARQDCHSVSDTTDPFNPTRNARLHFPGGFHRPAATSPRANRGALRG
jgi:hypothetical protein